MTKITTILGDITTQQVDAIVNAANRSLLGGGGVDGAIHNAAGSDLYHECSLLGGCNTGEAKITKGYKLPAKHIIHTVGPIYEHEEGKEEELLRSCYINVLALAKKHGIKTIAFPSISTGAFCYPLQEAVKIAVTTVMDFIEKEPNAFDEIRFVAFSDDVYNTYKNILI